MGSKNHLPTPEKNGEKVDQSVWKQYEFILCNKFGEPRLNLEGNPITVIGLLLEDMITKLF